MGGPIHQFAPICCSSPKIMPGFERSGIAHDSVGQQRAQIINPLNRASQPA